MLNTLAFIGEKLNTAKIVWAVGGSIMLNHYGLAGKPKDIDILIDDACAVQAAAVLAALGKEKPPAKTQTFATRHYHKYEIRGFDIDVMSGLAIWHESGLFCYIFDKESVTGCMTRCGVELPLASLEDWYVLYQLIPGRAAKVGLIEKYLRSDGIRRLDLLNRMLTQNLPQGVMDNVKRLLADK